MKKFLYGLIATFITCTVVLLGVQTVRAEVSQNSVLPAGEVYRGFFVRAAERVEVNGEVFGDVWAAGTEVKITGKVHGSVFAAAQKVIISGEVDGNTQTVASSVEITGKIKGAAYSAASEVTTSGTSSIGNGAMLVGSVVDLQGSIGNQAILAGSIVKINSEVNGNATINATQAELGSNAKINGNLKYNDGIKIQITNDKAITGSITKTESLQKPPSLVDRLRDVAFGLIINLLTGLVLFMLLPRSAKSVADYLARHPFESFFGGLGFVLLVPIAVILLLISYFGIQLAIFGAAIFVAVVAVGELFVALCIGNFITKPDKVNFASLSVSLGLGLIILTVLKIIPVLGGVVAFTSFLLGSGALSVRSCRRLKELHLQQKAAK